jgi:hypothetical protein
MLLSINSQKRGAHRSMETPRDDRQIRSELGAHSLGVLRG